MLSRTLSAFASRTARMTAATRLLLATFTLFLLVLPGWAQSTAGRILGTVSDQSGAAISGATIVVTDTQRGTARTMTSDDSGAYVAADLQPGTYKIHVEAKGFKSAERPTVGVEVATDIRADFSLQPGQVSETVTISEDIPLVNTTSSTLGGTLSNKEINDLPLNGRNYENLLQLRPGIIRYPGGGFSTTSSNGLRAEDNAYLVDGLFNSEPFSGQSIINGAGIAGDSATILPIDAIQEFNLQQNPSAEYGWKPGSIVNVGLKSGTNEVHGSAYAFGRDTPFDARNWFNTVASGPKNPRNLEQFGGTLGGALVKDKVFYFGAYEAQRYTVGNSGFLFTPATVSLPTPPTGPTCAFIASGDCASSVVDAIADVHAAFQADAIPNDVSSASLKIAGCTMGPPISCDGSGFPTNPGTGAQGATTIPFGLPNTVSADNAVGKIDDHLNDRNSLGFFYFFGNNSGTVSDASQLQTKWLTKIHTRAQVVGANWIWTPNSSWVNEARFGYNRLYQPTFTNDHTTNIATAYGLNTGVTNPLYDGLPRINVFPFYIFPQELGGFNWPKVQGPDTRIQFIDHISYIRGRHALKFGGELHRDAFSGGAYGGSRGRVKFIGGAAWSTGQGSSGMEDFFAGAPTNGTLLIGDPTRSIHNWGLAGFFQDDWRVTKNLTVNVGVRYELNTVIKEAHNLLGNFDPARGGLYQVGQGGVNGPYSGDHKDFAPRVGFAWDMHGNGRTVLRGGGGIMYETLNWESFLALNNSLGLATVPTGANGVNTTNGTIATGVVFFPGSTLNWNGTVFPGGNIIDCSPVTGGPCTIMGVDPHLKTPYVSNWTLNLQHSFTPGLVFEVAYVGDHGSRLAGIRDINQPTEGAGWDAGAISACVTGPPPATPFSNCVGATNGAAEQAARPFNTQFPFLAQIYQMGNIYRSNYNALQATLNGRNYHGLSFVAGYTYSHALDQVGANWDFGAGSGLPTDSAHTNREYASSDFDMRHRFTLSMTYLLPGRDGAAQMLKGWQINSIVTLSGAQPFGVMDASTDVSGTGELISDRWDFFGNTRDFKSTPIGIPFFPGSGDPANPSNAACGAKALALDGGTPGLTSYALAAFGCYASGSSVLIPPALGHFGTMGRNIFRDTGFKNVDFSVAKNFKWGERFAAQFRMEFFNIFNHPNFANPFGGQNGWAHNDPSTGSFGCSCATPDVAASNPVIGSGGSRAVQLGLKLTF